MNFLKKLLYKTVQQDSRNMEKVGDFFNWEWLQEEAKKNQEDPSKALRKAALSAATMYAGGLLGGAAGGAGAGAGAAGAASTAAPVAGGMLGQVAGTASAKAAEEMALLAAQEAAQQGLLGTAANSGGLLAEGGLTAAMTPGLSATGPGSQAAMLAQQNAGFGLTGMAKTAEAAAGAQGVGMGAKMGAQGLKLADVGLDVMAGNSTAGKNMREMQMAQGLLSPQPQQGMPPPPQRQQPQQQPMPQFQGYQATPLNTQPGSGFLPGADEEMKARLRAMGYQV